MRYKISGNGKVPGIKSEWTTISNVGTYHAWISVEGHDKISDATEEFLPDVPEEECSGQQLEKEWREAEEYETPEGNKLEEWLERVITVYEELLTQFTDPIIINAYGVRTEQRVFHFEFEAEFTTEEMHKFEEWNEEQGYEYDVEVVEKND